MRYDDGGGSSEKRDIDIGFFTTHIGNTREGRCAIRKGTSAYQVEADGSFSLMN